MSSAKSSKRGRKEFGCHSHQSVLFVWGGDQMRFSLSILTICVIMAGCQGPIMTGGFNQSPYRSYGVDGPGPGVIPESYQQMSAAGPVGAPPAGVMPVMYEGEQGVIGSAEMMVAPPFPMQMMAMRPAPPTSQINFLGLTGMVVNWDARMPGMFDSEPLVCPATHDFGQGAIYRLKVSSIPERAGKEFYPTLEIAPTMARTQAFLAHNSIPIELTDTDFDQVTAGNFITKVIYLPNPEYQGLAMAGVGTLVNTQLEAGVDPIIEASKRGAILAVIRMGNKDLSGMITERQRHVGEMKAAMEAAGVPAEMIQSGMIPGGYPVNGSSIPQNMISGVNIPQYGTPMTKTTTGIPGPPQLPRGYPAPNRYPVVRAEPIPAPPVGVEPQNMVMNPQYMSQMQGMQAMQQQPGANVPMRAPVLAPETIVAPAP
ncbi:MAG: hypothetical protein ACRCUY_13260 [Thermoguttaceae bacterium]